MKQHFPGAQPRSISAVYNCMGLVFANRRTTILPEHIERVLKEDGYRQLTDLQQAEHGDIVLYRDPEGEPCHVAVVMHKNLIQPGQADADFLTVLSQWGADGEYVHPLRHLPEILGAPSEFWTDRTGVE